MFDVAITMRLGGKDAGAYFGLSRDWVETYAAPPVPASSLGANRNTGREINLTRLSPKETSGMDSCNGSGPCRVIQCSVGGFVGKASNAHHKTAFIRFGSRGTADVKDDFQPVAISAASEATAGASLNEVEISPTATSMAGSAPHDPALRTAKVPITRAKSPRVAAFVSRRFGPMDRQNRRDRPNRSEFVICFSSANIAIGGIILRKNRGIKPLRIHREVLAKGNIHPFASHSLKNPGAFKTATCTAVTVNTGLTKEFVIRYLSAQVSRCYQQNSMLPENN